MIHQETVREFSVVNEIKAISRETFKDYYIAYSLAYLAGFREGTVIRHRESGDVPESARTVVVFHPETAAKFQNYPPELLWAGNPDILVSQLLNDRYDIRFSEERVKPELIDQIPDELRRVFSDKSLAGRLKAGARWIKDQINVLRTIYVQFS